jgi:hypothetical protein
MQTKVPYSAQRFSALSRLHYPTIGSETIGALVAGAAFLFDNKPSIMENNSPVRIGLET